MSSPSAVWRMQGLRYGTPEGGLRAFRCPEGHVHLAPRPVCPECAAALLAISAETTAIAVEFPVAVILLADVSV